MFFPFISITITFVCHRSSCLRKYLRPASTENKGENTFYWWRYTVMDGIGPSTVQQCREYELEQSICWLLFERWHHYWRRPRIEKVSLADSNFLTLRTFIQILIQLLDLDHLQLKRSMPRIWDGASGLWISFSRGRVCCLEYK